MVKLEFCNVEKVIFAVLYLQPLGHPYVVINSTVFTLIYSLNWCHILLARYVRKLLWNIWESYGLTFYHFMDHRIWVLVRKSKSSVSHLLFSHKQKLSLHALSIVRVVNGRSSALNCLTAREKRARGNNCGNNEAKEGRRGGEGVYCDLRCIGSRQTAGGN